MTIKSLSLNLLSQCKGMNVNSYIVLSFDQMSTSDSNNKQALVITLMSLQKAHTKGKVQSLK